MNYKIKNRYSENVIVEGNYNSLVELLVKEVAKKADLRGADLGGADLRGADLRGADLRSADLYSTNLSGADLRFADLYCANLGGADLRGADLSGADLDSANLGGAKINWKSHALIGRILFLSSGQDIEKRKIAGLIMISTDWCWGQFLAINDPNRDWALSVLAKYVTDGDDAPDVVRDLRK